MKDIICFNASQAYSEHIFKYSKHVGKIDVKVNRAKDAWITWVQKMNILLNKNVKLVQTDF